jgi:hypothetical protein
MDKIIKIRNKVYNVLGGSEAEKIMKSFYGELIPYDMTEKQLAILNSIYVKLVENEYFAELLGDACTKMQERIKPQPEVWKLAYVMKELLIWELTAIVRTDVIKDRKLSDETIEFFAEYTIGRFLANGEQLARAYDKVEDTLKQLESDIKENGEDEYKAEIDELWQFS